MVCDFSLVSGGCSQSVGHTPVGWVQQNSRRGVSSAAIAIKWANYLLARVHVPTHATEPEVEQTRTCTPGLCPSGARPSAQPPSFPPRPAGPSSNPQRVFFLSFRPRPRSLDEHEGCVCHVGAVVEVVVGHLAVDARHLRGQR